MRISDAEVKKIISNPGQSIVDVIVQVGEAHAKQQDQQLVATLAAEVLRMEDRDDVIEDLRAQIAEGRYNPSGEEIVDAMVRRAIADNVR